MSGSSEGSRELISRARALDAAGEYPGLVRLLSKVAAHTLLAEPELGYLLGYLLAYARRRTGNGRRALELIQELEAPCLRRGDHRLQRRRLNLEAMLRFEAGDVDAARRRWEELVEETGSGPVSEALATAYNNLGIVHTLQGRLDEALASYGRSLAAYQGLGDGRGVALAHQNLAILYRELGFRDAAEAHFQSAADLAADVHSEDVVGRAEEERALLQLLGGDVQLATATAERARARMEAAGDPAGEGEALRVLGLCALREHRFDEAAARLEAALARSRDAGAALLEAETLEALAMAESGRGASVRGASLRKAAEDLFVRMGASAWGERVRTRTVALTQKPS